MICLLIDEQPMEILTHRAYVFPLLENLPHTLSPAQPSDVVGQQRNALSERRVRWWIFCREMGQGTVDEEGPWLRKLHMQVQGARGFWAVVRRVRQVGPRKGDLLALVRGRRGEDSGLRVVVVRERYFRWKANAQVRGDSHSELRCSSKRR